MLPLPADDADPHQSHADVNTDIYTYNIIAENALQSITICAERLSFLYLGMKAYKTPSESKFMRHISNEHIECDKIYREVKCYATSGCG